MTGGLRGKGMLRPSPLRSTKVATMKSTTSMGTTAPRRRQGLGPHVPRWFVPRLERLEDRIVPVVVTPFTPRFSANAPGDVAIIGNTLETASTVNNAGRTAADLTAAQNGVAGPAGNHVDNNDWNMAYVDVDNDPTTFNSSQSALNLPTGAKVLFAGLYWGSVTTTPAQAAARNTVKFSTPASGGGQAPPRNTPSRFNFTPPPPPPPFPSFAPPTPPVPTTGPQTHTAANVQAALTDANGN